MRCREYHEDGGKKPDKVEKEHGDFSAQPRVPKLEELDAPLLGLVHEIPEKHKVPRLQVVVEKDVDRQ